MRATTGTGAGSNRRQSLFKRKQQQHEHSPPARDLNHSFKSSSGLPLISGSAHSSDHATVAGTVASPVGEMGEIAIRRQSAPADLSEAGSGSTTEVTAGTDVGVGSQPNPIFSSQSVSPSVYGSIDRLVRLFNSVSLLHVQLPVHAHQKNHSPEKKVVDAPDHDQLAHRVTGNSGILGVLSSRYCCNISHTSYSKISV